jgi:hypothetical protein
MGRGRDGWTRKFFRGGQLIVQKEGGIVKVMKIITQPARGAVRARGDCG